MTGHRCGYCYRPATVALYRRSLLRRVTRRPAVLTRVCTDHIDRAAATR